MNHINLLATLTDSWQRFRDRTPLLFPAACFAAGIVFAILFPDFSPGKFSAALILATLGIATAITKRLKTPLSKPIHISFFIAAGTLAVALNIPPSTEFFFDASASHSFKGTLVDISETNHNQTLTIKLHEVDSHKLPTPSPKAKVRVSGFEKSFERGEKLEFKCKLRKVVSIIDVEHEIDAGGNMLRKGLIFDGDIKSANSIKIIGDAPSIVGWCRSIGLHAGEIIANSQLSNDAKMFLEAIIVGDRSEMDSSRRELFSKAGVAHLLALSGTHVGVIAMLASMVLIPISLFGFKRLRNLTIVALLWFYAFATGSEPSVVRAATMLTVFLGAGIAGRKPSAWNSLMLASMIVLAFNPGAIADLGFQLSFAAVAGILMFGNSFNPVTQRWAVPHYFCGSLSVSLSATLGTAVISMAHFHFFPVYFLFANIFVGMIVPFIIGGGTLLVATQTIIGGNSPLLIKFVDTLCSITFDTIDGVASLPGSTIDSIFISWVPTTLFVVFLAMLKTTFSSSRSKLSLAFASSLFFMAFVAMVIVDSQPIDANEWFVNRSSERNEIIAANDGCLKVWNAGNDSIGSVDRTLQRYRHYMSRHGLDGPIATTQSKSEGLKDKRIIIGKHQIFIVDGATKVGDLPDRVDYLLIGRRTRLSHHSILGATSCDTIIHFGNLAPELRHLPNIDLSRGPMRRKIEL